MNAREIAATLRCDCHGGFVFVDSSIGTRYDNGTWDERLQYRCTERCGVELDVFSYSDGSTMIVICHSHSE